MSFSLLSLGWTGLNASKLLSEIAGHNTANVNTPGYSRQRVELSPRQPLWTIPGMLGTGVQASAMASLRNTFIESQILGALGDGGFSDGQIEALRAAQTALGIGQDDRLQRALSDFFAALSALSTQPSEPAVREQLLGSARALATAFAQVRSQIQFSRQGLDDELHNRVHELQQKLDQIALLNREIRKAEASGLQANDLRDQRGLLATQVAEQLRVRVVADDQGNLNLQLESGRVLVDGNWAARLRTVKDPTNDGLLSLELVSASGVVQRLSAADGGRLGGLLQARDQTIKETLVRLDTLAYDLITSVNTLHRAGFGLDGVGGRDFFTPLATSSGAAGMVSLDAAVAGNPQAIAAAADPASGPGDNRIALRLQALASEKITGGGTQDPYTAAYALGAFLGQGMQEAERDLQVHTGRISQLTAWRESVSGVSLEEEMIELAKAQRAFEAASKVIKTADQLLETVLSLKS